MFSTFVMGYIISLWFSNVVALRHTFFYIHCSTPQGVEQVMEANRSARGKNTSRGNTCMKSVL